MAACTAAEMSAEVTVSAEHTEALGKALAVQPFVEVAFSGIFGNLSAMFEPTALDMIHSQKLWLFFAAADANPAIVCEDS